MAMHDCPTCPVKGCPLRGIAPWLNEHEDEVDTAIEEMKPDLAKACVTIVRGMPLPIYDRDLIVMGIQAACCIGYHKGRTYQEVPEVYKQEDKK